MVIKNGKKMKLTKKKINSYVEELRQLARPERTIVFERFYVPDFLKELDEIFLTKTGKSLVLLYRFEDFSFDDIADLIQIVFIEDANDDKT